MSALPGPVEIRCSFFPRMTSTRPDAWQGGWSDLVLYIENATRYFGQKARKVDLPAISGAIYAEGGHRGLKDAEGSQLFLFDFDNVTKAPGVSGTKTPLGTPISVCEVAGALTESGSAAYLYSTWNHCQNHPKFRVIVPVRSPVCKGQWKAAVRMAISTLGLEPFLLALDRPVLENMAALAFLPGAPAGHSILRMNIPGRLLDLPAEQLREASQATESRNGPTPRWILTARNYIQGLPSSNAPSYRGEELLALLRKSGFKVGVPQAWGGGWKWRVHCPWASEHTSGVDDDGAVVFDNPGGPGAFHCSHSSHDHLSAWDLIREFGGVSHDC